MNEYKREKNTLKSELEEIRKKTRHHDDHIRAIDAWFKQLLDEVKTMSSGDDDEDMELSTLPTSLLFEDQPHLEQHITKRTKEIRTILSRLLSQSKSFAPDVIELQKRISELQAEEKSHLIELETLRAENANIELRLETATERYVVAEKKVERAKSVTVAKLEKQLKGGMKGSDDGVKKEELTNGLAETGEDYTRLETEHNKVLAASEVLKEQVEKLQQETTKLQSEVTASNAKSATLSDEDYSKTDLFKQFKAQHEDVIKKLNDVDARCAQLKDENRMLLQERTSYQNKLDDETRVTVAEKDTQLGQVEKDLVRIRAERDDLQAKLSMEKSKNEEKMEAIFKVRELCEAQEERIKSLESETQRLQGTSAMDVDDAQLEGLGPDEIRTKYQSLNQSYRMLSSELTSMSAAYQKASKHAKQNTLKAGEQEDKVQRLVAEKAKADQKYFAAMRSKDAREQEIRTLKLQTSKSSDIALQLKEAETASKALIANLEKQLTDMKEAHSSKTSDCRALQNDKDSNALELSRLKKQITDLTQQLTAKDAEMSGKSAATRTAEVEVKQLQSILDSTRKDLEKWKSRSGQSDVVDDLHSIVFCHCKKNMKDTVLKTCGHVMCSSCVEERVASRSRKCPLCSKSFGSNDYMRVTL